MIVGIKSEIKSFKKIEEVRKPQSFPPFFLGLEI